MKSYLFIEENPHVSGDACVKPVLFKSRLCIQQIAGTSGYPYAEKNEVDSFFTPYVRIKSKCIKYLKMKS